MPVVVAWIGEMLLSVVGQMVVSAAIALGIGFASNAVGNAVDFGSNIKSVLGGAGPLVAYLGFFKIDQAITVVLSALAGRRITDALTAHIVANKAPTPKA